MMNSKLLASGVVFLFVLSSLFVVVGDVNGMGTNTDNAVVYDLQGVYDGNSQLFGCKEITDNGVFVLENKNEIGPNEVIHLTCGGQVGGKNITSVALDAGKEGFVIPSNAALIISNFDVTFQNLTVLGKLNALKTANNASTNGVLRSEAGSNLSMTNVFSENTYFEMSNLSVDINCHCEVLLVDTEATTTVFKSDMHMVSENVTFDSNNLQISFKDEDPRIDGTLNLYKFNDIHFTIMSNDGFDFTENLTINGNDIRLQKFIVKHMDKGNTGWRFVSDLQNMNGSITFNDKNDVNGKDYSITLSGLIREGGIFFENLGSRSVPDVKIINASFRNMGINLTTLVGESSIGSLLFGSDDSIVKYEDDVRFILPDSAMTDDMIKSASDKAVYVSLYCEIQGEKVSFDNTIDNKGEHGHAIDFVANEGIHINAEQIFVKENGTIKLNDIKVTCDEGYEFLGWYYIDDNGVMKKLTGDEIKPTENMVLYALGAPGSGPTPTPATTPELNMGLIVGMSIALIVLAVGCAYLLVTRY